MILFREVFMELCLQGIRIRFHHPAHLKLRAMSGGKGRPGAEGIASLLVTSLFWGLGAGLDLSSD